MEAVATIAPHKTNARRMPIVLRVVVAVVGAWRHFTPQARR
jgi:hypothetical protein